MKILTKAFKIACIILLFTLSTIAANAQKLPPTQQISVFAPAEIKIDGKTAEWGNQLQAYNKATDIFYTLANDKDNLYLAVQATDPITIRKILNGGITLKIENAAITYPVFTITSRPIIDLKNKPAPTNDALLDKRELDSFVYVINKRFSERSKDIKVTGVPSITDSLISVYNENGIKASVQFDYKAVYNYELALPLKYLNLGPSSKFKYQIILSGTPHIDSVTVDSDGAGGIMRIRVSADYTKPRTTALTREDMAALTSPTDLKGEYSLAVK